MQPLSSDDQRNGGGGGKLVIRNVDASYGSYGLHVTQGGLTVRDANLQFIMKSTAVLDAAIDIRGGENLISNSQIEISMGLPSGTDLGGVGIDATDASMLTIADHSSIVMHSVDKGIAGGSALTISGSSLTIEESRGQMNAVEGVKLNIINGSEVNVNASNWPAVQAADSLVISGAVVNAKSAGSNGIYSQGSVEILDSSNVKAAGGGNYPGIYADGNISVKGSSMEASGIVGIQCQGLEVLDSSEINAIGIYPGIQAATNISIKDSSLKAESENNIGISCTDNLEIIGSNVQAISDSNSGISVGNNLTLEVSNVISQGTVNDQNKYSIFAGNDITITGGTTEIGEGSLTGNNINIGGIITSNGKPSYDNISSNMNGQINFSDADYGAVDQAIAKADALNKNDYKNYEIVEAAVKEIVRGKDIREQAVVDGYAAAIEAAIAALIPKSQSSGNTYQIIEGADQTVVLGEDKSITIRVNGDFEKFVSVSMDGNEIAKEFYTAVSGSTVITFKPEYVKTLTAGTHTVAIQFTDGLAQTTLTIKEKEKPGKPDQPDKKPSGTSSGTSSGVSSNGQVPGDGMSNEGPQQPAQNQVQEQKNEVKSPKTGDHTQIGWMLGLAAISALSLLLVKGRGKGKIDTL